MRGSYHGFFKHHHLSFDADAGRQEFQKTINRIIRRNGLAYELTAQGHVDRLKARKPLVDRVRLVDGEDARRAFDRELDGADNVELPGGPVVTRRFACGDQK